MKNLMLSAVTLFALSADVLFAQTLAGTWQGELQVGGSTYRAVFKISDKSDIWDARFVTCNRNSACCWANGLVPQLLI